MDAVDPGLQIGEDQVDNRQEFLCNLWVCAFGDRMVVEPALAKARIAAPVVRDDQRAGSDGVFDESAERVGATVRDDSETNASRVATVFPIVEFGPWCESRSNNASVNRPICSAAPEHSCGS